MVEITQESLGLLADRFAQLRAKLPEGWVWEPLLVKYPYLDAEADMEFNYRGYSRKEDHLVIFCTSRCYKNAKILLAYQRNRRVAAFDAARKAWLREDLTRPGEILEGCRCIIRIVSYPMPLPEARQEVRRPHSQKPHPVNVPVTVTKTAHHTTKIPEQGFGLNWKIHRVEKEAPPPPPKFVRKPLPTMGRIIAVAQDESGPSEVPILVTPTPAIVVPPTIAETMQSGLVLPSAPTTVQVPKKFFMRR